MVTDKAGGRGKRNAMAKAYALLDPTVLGQAPAKGTIDPTDFALGKASVENTWKISFQKRANSSLQVA